MRHKKELHVIGLVCTIYLLCFVFRMLEYFVLRTDQGVIGEAFLHKLMGIAIIIACCRYLGCSRNAIGFSKNRAAVHTVYGLLLGIGVFAVAYGVELIVLQAGSQSPALRFFVTSYAAQGNRAMHGSAVYILVCVLGNIINVIMEEGVFRGLFPCLMERRYSFLAACGLSSLLFGFWHITQPLRNWMDGEQSLAGACMLALVLVVTSTLFGVQLCLLVKITGSLWAGMGAHFVNNTTVNLLHVVTGAEYDVLQAMRVSIAQTLSFFIVLTVFLVRKSNKQAIFRAGLAGCDDD